ncbi:alpha-1,4-digalacturonate transport system substrate-binding protein [Catenuloplanes nepalensis]|uniref:Alpha-1,4-digalacturonate transport system substrate-binding protein n=1 Tax=Catenuloplanes nepalensis TaxID=587533 RepID=A0ABT9MQH7_9ACTN|nr:extracellular solute-binding protein [Catenuloplanes nepalensis]MDP9793326.1 alpha-1,4-digalacturonate transport system substrate-binding protein [Catenuloplanes nepalensis]
MSRSARKPLLALLAVLTLTACAPGGPDGGDTGQAEDRNLTYVYFTDGPDEAATRALIADFEKASGATVNLQVVPFANLEQQLQARLSGGNAPDVARLTELTPFRADLLDLGRFQQDALAGQFVEGATPAITGPGGELLAVPSDLTMNGPIINVAQFTKAGVALPDPAKPWTWAQMIEAAQAVQRANGTEFALAMDVSGHRFATMLSQYGTTYLNGETVTLDTARATAAITEFARLHETGAMPRDLWLQAGTKYKAANEIFLAQQVPVYISGNWQVSAFAKSAGFEWRVAPNPCGERCGGFPGGKFMASFRQSAHQELAAEFIAFMNSAESQRRLCREAAFLPTRRDLIASGVDYPSRPQDMGVFLEEVRRTPPDTFAANYSPGFGATARATVTALATVLTGDQTPEQAARTIRDEAQKAAVPR